MSQEQPPIRSRRELRKARDAQQASVSIGAEPPSPATNRPVPQRPGTVQASQPTASPAPEQTHTQRSSQIRARDRAALRTIKELEEKEGQLTGGGAPTRRQLRLQQLKEQTLTAANPVIAPASHGGSAPGNGAAAAAAPNAPNGSNPTPPQAKPAVPEGMTVEQALAARALIAEQAKNQIAKMEHIASLDPEAVDPEAVDPEILAEQIALAERAAVMNRRAMAKQKLAEQAGAPILGREPDASSPPAAGGPKPAVRPAPSAASNLAMVTPLEFVQVPGVDRPVMKPPATSHVPVTTRPGTKVPGTKDRRPAGTGRPPVSDAGPGRSRVIARAEAIARSAAAPKPVPARPAPAAEGPSEDLFEDLPRIPARSAHGLDPLDAATAGMSRARRNRVLQFCVLAFGILALVAGIILIISGMSR